MKPQNQEWFCVPLHFTTPVTAESEHDETVKYCSYLKIQTGLQLTFKP